MIIVVLKKITKVVHSSEWAVLGWLWLLEFLVTISSESIPTWLSTSHLACLITRRRRWRLREKCNDASQCRVLYSSRWERIVATGDLCESEGKLISLLIFTVTSFPKICYHLNSSKIPLHMCHHTVWGAVVLTEVVFYNKRPLDVRAAKNTSMHILDYQLIVSLSSLRDNGAFP